MHEIGTHLMLWLLILSYQGFWEPNFWASVVDEIDYLLKKFDIEKYFNYIVSFDDIENGMFKPHPQGIKKLIQSCPHKKMVYFGSESDDIIAGNLANIETVGLLYQNCDYNKMMNNYTHLGATHIIEDIRYIEDFDLNLKK